ncbi:MAG: Uma2 family endonuclease [Chloroflexota bacterium]|nr:Uma2 family endonuclease [Chloroflexota bacterium]MDE2895529.1 Uma2 family endonuclease [Chloroflexota bacterium]
MATQSPAELVTADELLDLSSKGFRGELIRGILCEAMPPGVDHAQIAAEISGELRSFFKPLRSGRVLVGDPGIKVESDPDTVRAPDVAFISASRLPLDQRIPGYSEVMPELVVEVKSPNDGRWTLYDKAQMWLRHGVRLVWLVYPEERTVEAHHADQGVAVYRDEDELDGMDVLPGFTCAVSPLFES